MVLIVDVIGWAGASLILVAYFLITRRLVDARSKLYHTLNLVGSIGLGYNTYYYAAYPSTVVNLFWMIIAIYGLLEALKKKRKSLDR